MRRWIEIVLAFSVLGLIAGPPCMGQSVILFADQDLPVGSCGIYSVPPNPSQWGVCIDCTLSPADTSINGTWCGGDVKWDTGVEAVAGDVLAISQTKNKNPIPGLFPYGGPFVSTDGLDGCQTSFFECAPASPACNGEDGPVAVAIHADVFNEYLGETAWAAECLQEDPESTLGCQEWGTGFDGRNWATYVHVPCDTGMAANCSAGLLTCSADSVEPYCRSINTEPEVCDGIDNDCDGVIDNGNPGGGESCSTGWPGECSTGTTECRDGSLVCQLPQPCTSCVSQCFDVYEYDARGCSQLYPNTNVCLSDCQSDFFVCTFSSIFSGDYARLVGCMENFPPCLARCIEDPEYLPNPELEECVNQATADFQTCISGCP